MQKNKELSYYRLRLENYLNDYHPHLLKDETFISSRSQRAEERYEQAFQEGYSIDIAESLALKPYYRG